MIDRSAILAASMKLPRLCLVASAVAAIHLFVRRPFGAFSSAQSPTHATPDLSLRKAMQGQKPVPVFAGSTPPRCGIVAAAAAAFAATRALVIRFGKRKGRRTDRHLSVCSSTCSFYKKKKWTVLKRRQFPEPALKNSDIKKRSRYAQLFRRNDIQLCETFWLVDPRDDRYQKSLEETRGYMDREANGKTDLAKRKYVTRDQLGLPAPPISVYQKSMAILKGMVASNKVDTGTPVEEKQVGKKKVELLPDFANIELDYLAFKGMQLTRKQAAKFATPASTGKGKK